MKITPIETVLKLNDNGEIIGWTDAFGTYELDRGKGLTRKIAGPKGEKLNQ